MLSGVRLQVTERAPLGGGQLGRVVRHNGIFLVGAAMDERAVQAELRRRDPGLFLDWEFVIRPNGTRAKLYGVGCRLGEKDVAHILWWADDYGVPLPLSSAILTKLDSLRREVARPSREVVAEANRRREAAIDAAADAAYDELEPVWERVGQTRVLGTVGWTPRGKRP